jgi:hypothetical protein
LVLLDLGLAGWLELEACTSYLTNYVICSGRGGGKVKSTVELDLAAVQQGLGEGDVEGHDGLAQQLLGRSGLLQGREDVVEALDLRPGHEGHRFVVVVLHSKQ